MTDSHIHFEKHIPITRNELAVIDWLSQSCPQLSKQKLKLAMQSGAVWLTHKNKTKRIRRAKKDLTSGDELHIYYSQNILEAEIEAPKLIADEGSYSIWCKPSGMYSQGTKWGDHSSICRWIEMHAFKDRQSLLVHRLDRATQGLIVVAHSKKSCRQLTQLFEQRQVEKIYLATVHGKFPEIEKEFLINSPINEKQALSKVLMTEYDSASDQTLLEVKIETGRKHQIRIHLSQMGFPIVGDRLYGNERGLLHHSTPQNLQLKSYKLSFIDPDKGDRKTYEYQ